jgi:hypothetical protein
VDKKPARLQKTRGRDQHAGGFHGRRTRTKICADRAGLESGSLPAHRPQPWHFGPRSSQIRLPTPAYTDIFWKWATALRARAWQAPSSTTRPHPPSRQPGPCLPILGRKDRRLWVSHTRRGSGSLRASMPILQSATHSPYLRCKLSVSQFNRPFFRMAVTICCQLHSRRRVGSLRFPLVATNAECPLPPGWNVGFRSSKTRTAWPFARSSVGSGVGRTQAASKLRRIWYVRCRGHGL